MGSMKKIWRNVGVIILLIAFTCAIMAMTTDVDEKEAMDRIGSADDDDDEAREIASQRRLSDNLFLLASLIVFIGIGAMLYSISITEKKEVVIIERVVPPPPPD